MERRDYLKVVIDSQRSPIEVFMGIQENKEASEVVDVRIGDPEFLKEKNVGTKEIPLLALESRMNELDKSKLFYVVTWSA